ncbi:hypothetical protein DERP_008500 [Dermatophagoides pteronyssinus]|uniref:Uncharacterized protein n=1 Tax=Dermatophagoides pteronyssinus TaxID=6956 RepID=A0ABQ8IVH0_DERPT|nr:hypothetical protein DERP_008500 [Dermatophagoides pteronyssinus]
MTNLIYFGVQFKNPYLAENQPNYYGYLLESNETICSTFKWNKYLCVEYYQNYRCIIESLIEKIGIFKDMVILDRRLS